MATTMHWLPTASLASDIRLGLFIAAVFIVILSAPEFNNDRMSSIELMPPPTVSGIKT